MKTNTLPHVVHRGRLMACTVLALAFFGGYAAAANKYVSPSGNDGNSGTEASPWKTLNFAFGQLSAGDTLFMRGGSYRESGITLSNNGASGNLITVINYPNESPVVDGAYGEFQTIGNTQWTLHDSATETYKSAGTSYPTGTWRGSFVSNDGELYRLFTYASLTHLMSTTYTFVAGGNYYRGPGFVRHTDGRIYIRIQNLSSPRDGGVPSGSTGNIKTVPSSASGFNPKDYKVSLSSGADLVTVTGDWIVFDGIAFENADRNVVLNGANNVDFLSCRMFGHRVGLRIEGGSNTVSVKWSDFESGHPPYVSWNEIKTSDVATEMKDSIGTVDLNSHTLTFEDNRFRKYFDGITIVQSGLHDIYIRHNAFDLMIDDSFQFGSQYNMEAGWNFINGPIGGYNGGSPPAGQENKKWWHHNVIDVRRDEFGRRNGEGGDGVNWRRSHHAIPRHSTAGSDDQVKIYNNTFLIEQNINNKGVSYQKVGGTTGTHEVYNNIIVQYDDREYNRGLGTGTDEKYDYQLFYKSNTGTFPRFNDFPPSSTDYADLAAWKSSSSATGNGYDQNSRESNPQFSSGANPTNRDYRPSSSGPANTGAKNLGSTGWPGATSASWVGAVDPSASTGLGDVGPRPRGTPPGAATNPSPANGATGVSLTPTLSWTAGSGATSHDVYFGTDSTPDSTEFQGNQTGTTFNPGTLTASTTYYWRIDEVNSVGTTTGTVWSFTTESGGGGGTIGFRAASQASASATSVTINKPAGVVSGDFMLAGISVSNQDATITAPSGWTLVRTITDTMRLSIYRKTAGGSEPASYTWNSSISRKLSGGIAAFTGVNASTPIQTENGVGEADPGTTHTTPTITTSGSSTWLVSLFGDRRDGGSTWTPPTGTTERVDVRTTTANNDSSLEINTVGPVSAGNYSHTATASGSSGIACMEIVAIQP